MRSIVRGLILLSALAALPVLAAGTPTMQVEMRRNGVIVPADVFIQTGVDVPLTFTWTLVDVPSNTRWQYCWFDPDAPVAFDLIPSQAVHMQSNQWSFPPETRTVTFGLHVIEEVPPPRAYQLGFCRAELPSGEHLYRYVRYDVRAPLPPRAYVPLIVR